MGALSAVFTTKECPVIITMMFVAISAVGLVAAILANVRLAKCAPEVFLASVSAEALLAMMTTVGAFQAALMATMKFTAFITKNENSAVTTIGTFTTLTERYLGAFIFSARHIAACYAVINTNIPTIGLLTAFTALSVTLVTLIHLFKVRKVVTCRAAFTIVFCFHTIFTLKTIELLCFQVTVAVVVIVVVVLVFCIIVIVLFHIIIIIIIEPIEFIKIFAALHLTFELATVICAVAFLEVIVRAQFLHHETGEDRSTVQEPKGMLRHNLPWQSRPKEVDLAGSTRFGGGYW
jgi:hypothetical protein